MTGQAHDELHKWLVSFLDLSAEFFETTTLKEAEIAYKKIQVLRNLLFILSKKII